MTLMFKLSMPNVGSWNNKWSGEKNFYAIFKSFTSKKAKEKAALLKDDSFYYDFGDGWGARVNVTEVSGAELKKFKKQSQGFNGYDWMVRSILDYGKILNDIQIAELKEALV